MEGQKEALEDHEFEKVFNALTWLADGPLFIDGSQIRAFYDAVVQPEGEKRKIVLSLEQYKDRSFELKGSGKGRLSASKLIRTVFPFVDAELELGVDAARSSMTGEKESSNIEIHPIRTPQRQLVQLAFHYIANNPERLVVLGEGELEQTNQLDNQEFIRALPRAVAFIDFPRKSKFIPMAAEVVDGRVIKVFDRLETAREKPPLAPSQREAESDEEFQARKKEAWAEYWGWFERTFVAQDALEVVEDLISKEGRIEWIDFRVPGGNREFPVHLHVCGRGKFSTGTFGYNLIKRGYSQGLRMVGTLKSKPDLNVLAIFEK